MGYNVMQNTFVWDGGGWLLGKIIKYDGAGEKKIK